MLAKLCKPLILPAIFAAGAAFGSWLAWGPAYPAETELARHFRDCPRCARDEACDELEAINRRDVVACHKLLRAQGYVIQGP